MITRSSFHARCILQVVAACTISAVLFTTFTTEPVELSFLSSTNLLASTHVNLHHDAAADVAVHSASSGSHHQSPNVSSFTSSRGKSSILPLFGRASDPFEDTSMAIGINRSLRLEVGAVPAADVLSMMLNEWATANLLEAWPEAVLDGLPRAAPGRILRGRSRSRRRLRAVPVAAVTTALRAQDALHAPVWDAFYAQFMARACQPFCTPAQKRTLLRRASITDTCQSWLLRDRAPWCLPPRTLLSPLWANIEKETESTATTAKETHTERRQPSIVGKEDGGTPMGKDAGVHNSAAARDHATDALPRHHILQSARRYFARSLGADASEGGGGGLEIADEPSYRVRYQPFPRYVYEDALSTAHHGARLRWRGKPSSSSMPDFVELDVAIAYWRPDDIFPFKSDNNNKKGHINDNLCVHAVIVGELVDVIANAPTMIRNALQPLGAQQTHIVVGQPPQEEGQPHHEYFQALSVQMNAFLGAPIGGTHATSFLMVGDPQQQQPHQQQQQPLHVSQQPSSQHDSAPAQHTQAHSQPPAHRLFPKVCAECRLVFLRYVSLLPLWKGAASTPNSKPPSHVLILRADVHLWVPLRMTRLEAAADDSGKGHALLVDSGYAGLVVADARLPNLAHLAPSRVTLPPYTAPNHLGMGVGVAASGVNRSVLTRMHSNSSSRRRPRLEAQQEVLCANAMGSAPTDLSAVDDSLLFASWGAAAQVLAQLVFTVADARGGRWAVPEGEGARRNAILLGRFVRRHLRPLLLLARPEDEIENDTDNNSGNDAVLPFVLHVLDMVLTVAPASPHSAEARTKALAQSVAVARLRPLGHLAASREYGSSSSVESNDVDNSGGGSSASSVATSAISASAPVLRLRELHCVRFAFVAAINASVEAERVGGSSGGSAGSGDFFGSNNLGAAAAANANNHKHSTHFGSIGAVHFQTAPEPRWCEGRLLPLCELAWPATDSNRHLGGPHFLPQQDGQQASVPRCAPYCRHVVLHSRFGLCWRRAVDSRLVGKQSAAAERAVVLRSSIPAIHVWSPPRPSPQRAASGDGPIETFSLRDGKAIRVGLEPLASETEEGA